jgi:PEP-CTERM motif
MKIQQMGLQGSKCQISSCFGLIAGLVVFASGSAFAQNITLSNGGSTAVVNPGNGTGQLGMNYWNVDTDNQNQLAQQWFWYSTDGGHTVQSLNTLGLFGAPTLTGGNDLTLNYGTAQFGVSIEYLLAGTGTGSGGADIMENISVFNNTASTVDFNLYQYSHFQLLNLPNNSVIVTPDGSSGYSAAQQASGSTAIAEGIINPDATSADTGLAGSVLSDVLSGTLNNHLSAGPGDVAWAFGWSTNIVSGGEFDIEKDKSLSIQGVPEPSTFALIGLGLGAVGLLRRRSC